MGKRKRETAERRKEAMKSIAYARLQDYPTSPFKMRLVADLIRGKRVEKALNLLKFSTKDASVPMEKVLLSAINNWQNKNESMRIEDQDLFVSEVYVDSGSVLKRLQTAPQGRGHRLLKRSNHVTLVLGNMAAPAAPEQAEVEEEEVAEQEAVAVEKPAKEPAKKKPARKSAGKKAAVKKAARKSAKKTTGDKEAGEKEE